MHQVPVTSTSTYLLANMTCSKKDNALRRQQLLDYVAPHLISSCAQNADTLIRSDYGRDVLYETLNEAPGMSE